MPNVACWWHAYYGAAAATPLSLSYLAGGSHSIILGFEIMHNGQTDIAEAREAAKEKLAVASVVDDKCVSACSHRRRFRRRAIDAHIRSWHTLAIARPGLIAWREMPFCSHRQRET